MSSLKLLPLLVYGHICLYAAFVLHGVSLIGKLSD